MDDRLTAAALTADWLREHAHLTEVGIHVGTDVWDVLRSRAIDTGMHVPDRPTLFGFPLAHDHLAHPDHVSVRTVTTIA